MRSLGPQILIPRAVPLLLCILFLPFGYSNAQRNENNQNQTPSIAITKVPPQGGGPDVMARIAGKVRGANGRNLRVVVFARTNTWYVQPFTAAPYTVIKRDGNWSTQIHLGDEYAALLVETTYQPPATTDELPQIGGPILAITTVSARTPSTSEAATNGPSPANPESATRVINFSGFTWKVKSSRGKVGPGPNHFSDRSANVAVDARGRLHLRITKQNGRWYCAEVISSRSFGYGTYKFHLGTNTDNLDPRVVLGMFTWSDNAAFSHREIDVEISRWGTPKNQNAQFVVQPYTNPANIFRFAVPTGLTSTLHLFTWTPADILFRSLDGAGKTLQEKEFSSGIPPAGDENARLNLWLVNGAGPVNGRPVEVIIDKFEFIATAR